MADRTQRPILVTGSHRSGSTWVGRMLDLSPAGHYVHEPFAPMNHRSWLADPPTIRYVHQVPEVAGPWASDLERIVALRPRWAALLGRCGDAKDLAWLAQEYARTARSRGRGARAIIKDPFALLSAEWIHERSDARVIVLMRHPAAFVSSIERLGWRLDVGWLLQQEELMAGDLAAFRGELEADGDQDIIGHAILVWRVLTSVINRLRDDHPDWVVTRYEELALDPVPRFHELYEWCGLPFDEDIAVRLRRLNSPRHGAEVASSSKGGVVRDSRSAVWTWQKRLDGEAVARVRRDSSDFATGWYDEDRWWQPAGV